MTDISFSKRLRNILLEISSDLDSDSYQAILGLALTLAGRFDETGISIISEHGEYLDMLVLAAQKANFTAPERRVYAKGESLVFDLNNLGNDFKTALQRTDFISKSTLPRQLFLAHSYLACGSLADPNIQFSLEWQIATEKAAKALKSKLAGWSLETGITPRKRIYVLYIKNGEKIADFLIMCGATDLLLEFIDIHVKREVSARVNRLMNCDEANTNRQVDASARQLEAIRYIAASSGLNVLPDNLRLAAEARLAAPELSIKELGEQMEPPLGKSGMNHRLTKLEEIAEELRLEEQTGGKTPS
jgi:DNA-binding protein WhiA